MCCYGPTTREIDVQAWKQFYMANHTNKSGHAIFGSPLMLHTPNWRAVTLISDNCSLFLFFFSFIGITISSNGYASAYK